MARRHNRDFPQTRSFIDGKHSLTFDDGLATMTGTPPWGCRPGPSYPLPESQIQSQPTQETGPPSDLSSRLDQISQYQRPPAQTAAPDINPAREAQSADESPMGC